MRQQPSDLTRPLHWQTSKKRPSITHTDHTHSCVHDWIKPMIAAARLPLRSDQANNQLERPSAHGLIWLSTWLLSMGTAPSSR